MPRAPGTDCVPESWVPPPPCAEKIVIPSEAARLSLSRRFVARRAAQSRDLLLSFSVLLVTSVWPSLLIAFLANLSVLCASALSFLSFPLSKAFRVLL